jgi:hypothetical protein
LSEEHIAWHPAFVEAIQAELEEYKDVLEFYAEYPLTTEPLRIDVLVVKKRADVVIRKNIARIFREHNIIEYKSPDDYVSWADFQKVQAYAWLYASLQNLPPQSLTVTFVQSGYPRSLIQHLKTDLGHDVEESEPGLYIIKGMSMPAQIIESKKLSAGENMWLRNLREAADVESFTEVLRVVQERGKGAPLKAYMHVLFTAANLDVVKEAKKMATTMELFEVFRDVFGFDKEWEEKIREEGQRAMARNPLSRGVDPAIIAGSSDLAFDKIQKIATK